MATRQLLPGASIGIYVNHTLSSSTWTGEKGEALLWVPYSPRLSLTLVASMEGYVPSPLPWSTIKKPGESLLLEFSIPLWFSSILLAGKKIMINFMAISLQSSLLWRCCCCLRGKEISGYLKTQCSSHPSYLVCLDATWISNFMLSQQHHSGFFFFPVWFLQTVPLNQR